jgi:hypothetical protein
VLPWWGWVLLWVVLVAGAAVLLFVLGRRTWRSARALQTEIARAAALVGELESRIEELTPAAPEPIDVIREPRAVIEAFQEVRQESRDRRRARHEARRPPWARRTYTG